MLAAQLGPGFSIRIPRRILAYIATAVQVVVSMSPGRPITPDPVTSLPKGWQVGQRHGAAVPPMTFLMRATWQRDR